MKKVIYNRYGSFDDLQMAEVDIPGIQSDEFLIKVKAVAINPLDWKKLEGQLKIITGKKFPKGIAFDFSGIIENAGNNTTNFKTGDEVFGTLDAMKGEALAEYIVVKTESICKKPKNVSFETAAAILTGGTTAIFLLNKAKIKAGDEVLINGASGGVGMVALQVAKLKGAKVATVASGKGLDFIHKWHPDRTIDYKKDKVTNKPEKYDAIFELAGSLPFSQAKNLLKPNGIYVSTLPNPVDMIKAFFNNLFSAKKNIIIQAHPNQKIFNEISNWMSQNIVEMPVAKTFRIDEFKEAYHFAKKGGAIGKVVFTIP
ncbi:MAG: NAD(P)-dependent alcohol dehydrogenase [Saprospiraceae bacterium]|nr:NAD(P)-dependent alcohol dehydrogenase [Saprospiraceae bacterium]